jgi:hypothetical protein
MPELWYGGRLDWNFADFVGGHFQNGGHSPAIIIFLVRIFYQSYLIYMPSLVDIPLAVSDISGRQNRQNFNVLWFQWKLISRVILKWGIDW